MTAPASRAVRETIALPHGSTEVEWRRSVRARRISLRIAPAEGIVILTLPMRAARRSALALLADNAGWVADRLAALPDAVELRDGAAVPIDGAAHLIRHCPHARFAARLSGDVLEVAGDPAFLARRVRDFLRHEARRRLSVRVADVSARAGLAARRVSVKDTSSRWGSCSADRGLSFSWRLVMAPPHVQHYVVAHEVAHLRHMNHGPEFWQLVAQLDPAERAARDWLRRHGASLLRIG